VFKRIQQIKKMLDGWQPLGGWESYRQYELMLASNYAVLPYAGGWLDQPQWWLDDVDHFMLMDELMRLNSELPKVPAQTVTQPKQVSETDE
jgi:hypothetical protein